MSVMLEKLKRSKVVPRKEVGLSVGSRRSWSVPARVTLVVGLKVSVEPHWSSLKIMVSVDVGSRDNWS